MPRSDRMLKLSDSISAMLAAETDSARSCEILDTEIREALTGVADSIDEGVRLRGTSEAKPLAKDVVVTSI